MFVNPGKIGVTFLKIFGLEFLALAIILFLLYYL